MLPHRLEIFNSARAERKIDLEEPASHNTEYTAAEKRTQ